MKTRKFQELNSIENEAFTLAWATPTHCTPAPRQPETIVAAQGIYRHHQN
jgi:hypothetical protein